MSEAWNLFGRSLTKAYEEYGAFVKIWFMTLLVMTIIMFIMGMFVGDDLFQYMVIMSDPAAASTMTPEQLMQIQSSLSTFGFWNLIFSLLYLVVVSGLSVNSLRYFYGKFQPSWMPFNFDWGTSFAFIGWTIVLGLLLLAILIIPLFIAVWFIQMAMISGSGFMIFLGWIVMIAAAFFSFWVGMRLYNKLVARAIGQDLTFGEAWRGTKGSAMFFFGLVIFVSIFGFISLFGFTMIAGLIMGLFNSPTLIMIFGFIFAILYLMLAIYMYAVAFAITVDIYEKFFGEAKTA